MQILFDFFLRPHLPTNRRAFAWGWLVLVYLAGAGGFGLFFDWGRDMPLFHDWADVNVPRLTFLRDAVQTGQFPLHISNADAMHGGITRYLTIPDGIISPQIVLLARFSVLRFNLINVLLLYTAGFAGLLALRSRLSLSLFTFTLAVLLFYFNANILAHYSVGHLTWGGYFLFPWAVLLVLDLAAGNHSWRWTFWMSCLLFLIWIQGSFHQTVWLLLLLGLCALFIRGAFFPVLRTILCALLLSAFRILPASLLLGQYAARFNNGFPGLTSLFDVLANPGKQAVIYPVPAGFDSAGSWEFSAYIGLAAVLCLLYFGLAKGLAARSAPYRALALPLAGMLLLSLNDVFAWLRLLPLPLIQGERVVTRILALPLAFFIILAAERFQRWAEDHHPDRRVPAGAILFLLLTLNETWLNFQDWRVSHIRNLFLPVNFYPDKWYAANNTTDTAYLWMVFGGLAITLLTLIGLALAAFGRKKHAIRGGNDL